MVRHCLLKMSATPGACIKPGLVRRMLHHKVNFPSCVARQPLCHKVNLPSCVARRPLCHKVNLPRCEAGQCHLIMTWDIFATGKTNTLTRKLLKALTGLVLSLNSDVKAFKTVNSIQFILSTS